MKAPCASLGNASSVSRGARVRVGQRVWLPFLRAHRYMRSSQALLDFSLGQLHRVAERHRG